MLEFTLLPNRLKPQFINETTHTYLVIDDTTISLCIEYFNSEIKWDAMFTLDIAKSRIANKEYMYAGYSDNMLFGYFWMKETSQNEYYIYNVFSKKTKHSRIYGATDMIYDVIKRLDYKKITANVDSWNIKSINVFEKLGFIETN